MIDLSPPSPREAAIELFGEAMDFFVREASAQQMTAYCEAIDGADMRAAAEVVRSALATAHPSHSQVAYDAFSAADSQDLARKIRGEQAEGMSGVGAAMGAVEGDDAMERALLGNIATAVEQRGTADERRAFVASPTLADAMTAMGVSEEMVAWARRRGFTPRDCFRAAKIPMPEAAPEEASAWTLPRQFDSAQR